MNIKDLKIKKIKLDSGPEADWEKLFFSALFVLALIFILDAVIFLRLGKQDVFGTSEPAENEQVNLESLRETVRYYQLKAVEFERIRRSATTTAPDPSV